MISAFGVISERGGSTMDQERAIPRVWSYGDLLVILALLLVVAACNTPGSEGAVWIDNMVITSGIDANGDPIDEVEVFPQDVKRVNCFIAIRGPENVQLGVRWFRDDQFLGQSSIPFGTQRKNYAFVAGPENGPLMPGTYRCEVFAIQEPLRSVTFRVE